MEAGQYSKTALATAYIRAYHAARDTPRIFDDFLAHRLIKPEECRSFGPPLADLQPTAESADEEAGSSDKTVMDWWIKVIAGAILARARYTEDCIEKAVRRGMHQYVILGAGMDTFALRRPEFLKELQVFEIDHPETQAFKRERLAQANLDPPAALHFVPVDLARERLSAALERSSYNPKAMTLFSWPGVTYYLTREEVLSTFGAIRTLAPSGSAVVFDYLDSGFFAPENPHKSVHLVLEKVQGVGEPMNTGFDPPDLAAELARLGYRFLEDMSATEIERHYFSERTDGYHAGQYIHFAQVAID